MVYIQRFAAGVVVLKNPSLNLYIAICSSILSVVSWTFHSNLTSSAETVTQATSACGHHPAKEHPLRGSHITHMCYKTFGDLGIFRYSWPLLCSAPMCVWPEPRMRHIVAALICWGSRKCLHHCQRTTWSEVISAVFVCCFKGCFDQIVRCTYTGCRPPPPPNADSLLVKQCMDREAERRCVQWFRMLPYALQ